MMVQSPTYHLLIQLMNDIKAEMGKSHITEFEGGTYKRTAEGNTVRIRQDIVITDMQLFDKCTSAMWHVIGHIMKDLKEYNVLWECPVNLKKNNNTTRKAIAALVEMKLLITTEVTNIYIVNPLYLRRGDFHGVLATTANMIREHGRLDNRLITNKRAVNEFKLIGAGIAPAP